MFRIRFRCNRMSLAILRFMKIIAVAGAVFSSWLMLNFFGITKGPEEAPLFFRQNYGLTVCIIFMSIPFFMLVFIFVVLKIWSSMEEKGAVRLEKNYAVLYYRKKEVKIYRKELEIRKRKSWTGYYWIYILKIPRMGKRILISSIVEKNEKIMKGENYRRLSLDIVMEKLKDYEKPTFSKIKK